MKVSPQWFKGMVFLVIDEGVMSCVAVMVGGRDLRKENMVVGDVRYHW